MNVETRIRFIRLIDKMNRDPKFSEELGIKDKSKLVIGNTCRRGTDRCGR